MAIISRTPPLNERIAALRAELDSFIDARVSEIKKHAEGVPEGVIRNLITRGSGCQCAAYLDIKTKDDEAAARDNAA